jgi:phospholipid/cholesterol/gamma-HCH transport system ATP-binding protein
MLELINIKKQFNQVDILKNVNLTVNPGENITIIGTSGSGKSTILKLILGLIEQDSGTIMFNGVNPEKLSTSQFYEYRKYFGLLFQSSALFDSLTVEENIAFPLTEQPNNLNNFEINKKVDEALELVEMKGANLKNPSELSGGQQKRIALARAIITKPKCLLFDEPTTGLDPVLSTNIEDLIVRIATELNTISITVTHQISTILRISDLIYFLNDGILLAPETTQTIMVSKNPIIRSFIHGGIDETK